MTTPASAKRLGIILATATWVLAACSPSSGGGGGDPVVQPQPVTVSTQFNFTQAGGFTVGSAPANAVFTGGIALNGKWIIEDGETGIVTFSAPTRLAEFSVEGLEPAATASLFAKAGLPRLFRKTTCGVSGDSTGPDDEAFGVLMYMRGTFSDPEFSTSEETQFYNTGGGVYQAEFEITAAQVHRYKIADAAWDDDLQRKTEDKLDPGDTLPLVEAGLGASDGELEVTEAGCYNFTWDINDPENETVTMTKVTLDTGGGGPAPTCGVSDQSTGADDEAFGVLMYMRGTFSDPEFSTSEETQFYNTGGGIYQAEFEIDAVQVHRYKIADAAWDDDLQRKTEDKLDPGDTLPLVEAGLGASDGELEVTEPGCYNFTWDINDPENETVTMSMVDLTPPPGGGETCGVADESTGADDEAFGVLMYMRGTFSDPEFSTSEETQFYNTGGGIYQAEFEITAVQVHRYKIADAAWDDDLQRKTEDKLDPGDTLPLVEAGLGASDGELEITEPGCYNFTWDLNDPENETVTMSKVDLSPPGGGKEVCGIANESVGNDDAAFGVLMYMRGTFSNPEFATSEETQFYNTGGGIYQAEFEIDAVQVHRYKIADAAWDDDLQRKTEDKLDPGDTLPLVGAGLGATDGELEVTVAGCYNFSWDLNDPENETLTMTEVELGGGGPIEPPGTTDITAIDTTGATVDEQSIEGAAVTPIVVERPGPRDTAVKRIEIFAGNGDTAVEFFRWTVNPVDIPDETPVRLFYHRPEGDYSSTVVNYAGEQFACDPALGDGFGCAVDIVGPSGGVINFTVTNDGTLDPTGQFTGPVPEAVITAAAVYAFSGNPAAVGGDASAVQARPGENEVILYYLRGDGNYEGWNLHLFPQDPQTGDWTIFEGAETCVVEGVDSIGGFFRITLPPNPCYDNNPEPLEAFPNDLGVVIHRGSDKEPDADLSIRIAEQGNIVFVESDSPGVGTAPPGGGSVAIVGRAAHWVDRSTILWRAGVDVVDVELAWSPDASIGLDGLDITGNAESAVLSPGTNPMPENQLHLDDYPAFEVPQAVVDDAMDIARDQIVVVGRDRFGVIISATYVQIPGLLDDLYASESTAVDLGVTWSGTTPTVRLWAPTAKLEEGVTLNLYSAPGVLDSQEAMQYDDVTGVWSVTGDSGWDRMYYDFTLAVYSYATTSVVTNTVTDPYSAALSANSAHSMIVNLDDQDLKPAGWDALALPEYGEPEDIVIYEQHMRDFSASDFTVPEELRGKYKAFTLDNTDGHAHLQALSDSGLTHMHLLPSFDIATIDEVRANRVELDDQVDDLCAANPAAAELCPQYSGMSIRELLEMKTLEDPASEFQQQVVVWLRNFDGYNWGYDPWHYGVPEGSYATDPDGVARIIEYREMIQGLADKGLRLIIDVVYNHTNQAGQNDRSVLDRVVPGYYHRYNETTGAVETSTCCSNTASEFAMMGKLMDDTMIQFVEDYKITGFRYDLMGFHTKAQMQALLGKLRAIDPSVYVYGEGWNFGEVGGDRRFVQATQENLAGTGIGTFTDRIRDAVRGGGPFDSGELRTLNQGFINGGGYDANDANSPDDEGWIEEALCTSDQLRATMAGSIADYQFLDRNNMATTGADLGYSRCTDSSPTGYVSDPEEIINYASSHDNETIFDISQYKHATDVSSADRVRAENVGMDVIVLAQGIPFLHSGQDLLRSKSVDRDSFDFGDWFNLQDFSRMDNNWAVGLPNAEKNQGEWPDIAELFDNPNSEMTPDDITFAHEHLKEMLQIRSSTVLYRLRNADQIKERVRYFNVGTDQTPGLIVQGIDGCADDDITPEFGYVMTIVNANDEDQTVPKPFSEGSFELHPVQQDSIDPVVQTASFNGAEFYVPARTTAVFVDNSTPSCSPFGVQIFVRGLNSDWDSANEFNELFFDGDKSYTGTLGLVDTTPDDRSFKIADAVFELVNCGAGADPNVELDQPYVLNCDPNSGNLNLNVELIDNYQFRVDASDPANPVLTVLSQPYGVDIFVRGFDADWNANSKTRMDLVSSNTYQVTLGLTDAAAPGALDFKVASDDWSSVDCGSSGSDVPLGAAYSADCSGGAVNMVLAATDAGEYSFKLDATDPVNPVLVVEKGPYPVSIFIRGLNGDWSESNPLKFVGGTSYEARIPVEGLGPGDLDFKIASSDWSTVDCGDATGNGVDPDTLTSLNCAGGAANLLLNTASTGDYTFSLDATDTTNPDLLVSGP